MTKIQIVLLVVLVVFLGIIISLVYRADTYASFSDAKMNPDREFNIIGSLNLDKPVEQKIVNNTLLLTFFMIDENGGEAKVHYLGPKPTDFEKSDQVVIIGKYEDDVFIASSLLLKCPSKYNQEITD